MPVGCSLSMGAQSALFQCMCAYGAKISDRQIKNSPIPTESQFTKFNARQIFKPIRYKLINPVI